MAEAVLFNIAEDLLKNMASKALEEIAAAWGFKDQLEKLRDTTTTIKDVLSDAERKQVESAAVRGWLEKLRVVVYDADDLFDEFSTMVTRKELMKGSKLSKEARLFFSSSNQLAFAFKMAREVKKIRERLDDAVKNADQFAFRRLHGNDGPSVSLGSGQQTISYVAANEVIGRDEDKKAIIDILLDANVQESISVVSIFGIGGMGKTALAQLVYNDEKIQSHFELKLWACVSDVFDMKEVVRKILASSSDTKIQEMEIEQLQRQLRKLIDGKKYLLVLDDVWNEDPAKWLELRGLLTVGGTGSRILLTTRSSLVAKVAGANPSYDLKGLSEEKSWSLFERMAFEGDRQPKLVELGKEIVQKCANVPLAIRVLGCFLKVGNESTWRHFKESELAGISKGGDAVMSILEISYHHLESSLKNCFAYCALFPKDYEMDKETLIYLWMAEGFLVPNGRSLEDTGEDYFMTLLQRGFFQDVTYYDLGFFQDVTDKLGLLQSGFFQDQFTKLQDGLGGIRSCKMHDLMHDLACRVAGNESKVIGTGDIDRVGEMRPPHHLSFGHPSSSSVIPASFQLKSLRTFLLPVEHWRGRGHEFSKTLCGQIISSFSCLRVLDLHYLQIETLPSSIGGLVHLRYLDLSGNYGVTQLPASITELQNLQTLKLDDCFALKALPGDVKKLINLRHLGLNNCHNLASMPAGMGTLTALHKLDVFLVGIHHRASVSETKTARLRDLKALDKLSGRLCIQILGEMKDPVNEAKEANLSSKHGLSELVLEGKLDEAVLDGLQPPPNLPKLLIRAYSGQRLPTWASMDSLNSSLPDLVVVGLWDWGSCLNVPLFSRLRSLKRLSLCSLKSVEYMENSRYDASSSSSTSFFPSLEVLQLHGMHKLKSWWWMEAVDAGQRTSSSTSSTEVQPQHIQQWFFPRLHTLIIWDCPSLKSMPLCPNVEELDLRSVNKELRVLTTVVMPREGASRLKAMRIDDIDGLISLPTDCLPTGLTSLRINYNHKLLDLSSLAEVFRSLSSLESLQFYYCYGLRSLHGGLEHLSSLKKMAIWDCEQLDLSAEDKEIGMPWKALKGLQSLGLRFIHKMLVLPDGLRHLTALRSLEIGYNDELMTIPEWIDCLGSLEFLSITLCPKVETLPEGIRFLTSLKRLEIFACSGLRERCRGPNGDDWPKIQHIPVVEVGCISYEDNARLKERILRLMP